MERGISFFWIVLCIFLFKSITAQNEVLLPVKQNKTWGYCNMQGEISIPFQYEHADLFDKQGLAPVKINGNAYLINTFGEVMSQDGCHEVKAIGKDIYACYNGSEWKLHGRMLKQAGPAGITKITACGKNWMYFTKSGAGLMNIKGETILEARYDLISVSEDADYLLLYKDSMIGIATADGKLMWEPKYYSVDFRAPGIFIARSSNKIAIRNINGKISTDTGYVDLQTRSGSPFIILYDSMGRSTGFHHNTGRMIVCDSSEYVDFFDKDYLLHFVPGGLNLLDSSMRPVFTEPFESIRRETEGFVVRKNGLYGFCNTEGNLVHEAIYNSISIMVERTAITKSDNKSGIIHSSGTVIASPDYEKVEVYNTTAKAYKSNSVTVYEFDERGKILDESAFSNFKTIKLGGYKDNRKPSLSSDSKIPPIWFYEPSTRKWGLQTEEGKILIEPSFDFVERMSGSYSKVGIVTGINSQKDLFSLHISRRWGLVNHETGDFLLNTNYASIQLDTNSMRKGEFILLNLDLDAYLYYAESRSIYGPYAYIGKSNGRSRPIALKGQWQSAQNDTSHRKLCTYAELFNGLYTGNRRVSGVQIPDSLNNLMLTDARFSIWNDVDEKFYRSQFPYLSKYTKNTAVFGTWDNQFGVINHKADTLIRPNFDKIDVIHTDSSLFFLTHKKRETFGFIKENGEWAFEQQFLNNANFKNGRAVSRTDKTYQLAVADTNGQLLYTESVSKYGFFSEELLPVKIEKNWVYLDKNLMPAINPKNKLYWAGQFEQGLAPVKYRGHYGYITPSGQPAFETTFEKAMAFEPFGGLVKVRGKWGIINEAGEYIVKPAYSYYKYKKGDSILALNKNGTWYLFDMQAQAINKAGIRYYKPFTDGFAQVRTKNGTMGILSIHGKIVKPGKKDNILSVQGTFVVMAREEYGILLADTGLKEIGAKEFIQYKFGSEGIIFARKRNRLWYALDDSGNILFQLPGYPLSGFKEGYAIVKLPDNRQAYINRKGELAFGEFFIKARPFQNGIAYINTSSGMGIINNSGAFIVSPKYKYIGPFSEGLAAVQTSSLIGISNASGNSILNSGFDYVKLENAGVFRVENADYVGWVSKTGKVIWKPSH